MRGIRIRALAPSPKTVAGLPAGRHGPSRLPHPWVPRHHLPGLQRRDRLRVPDCLRQPPARRVASAAPREALAYNCEIALVRAEGVYTEVLTTRETSEFVHKTMKEWERRLPTGEFVRIHRSTIVNLRYVDRFDESPRHHFRVFMKHADRPIEMSRRYASDLRRKMA